MRIYSNLNDIPQHYKFPDTCNITKITEKYPLQITDHCLSIIDFNNSQDPILKQYIPSIEELTADGYIDTSNEKGNTVFPGVQHKYQKTVLVLTTNKCAAYCRYCFRKRMVGTNTDEVISDTARLYDYIRSRNYISNVLLSGGDSLILPTAQIEEYLVELSSIEHLKYIRFGTRLLSTSPEDIVNNRELIRLFQKYSAKKNIIVVNQFNHSKEITKETISAVRLLCSSGVRVYSQTVLLRGINDTESKIVDLMQMLVSSGIDPYYIFQCRPVRGAKHLFQVPIIEGVKIINNAQKQLDGICKQFRYIMSHETGKIEIIGLTDQNDVILKYHQAHDLNKQGQIFTEAFSANQCWL